MDSSMKLMLGIGAGCAVVVVIFILVAFFGVGIFFAVLPDSSDGPSSERGQGTAPHVERSDSEGDRPRVQDDARKKPRYDTSKDKPREERKEKAWWGAKLDSIPVARRGNRRMTSFSKAKRLLMGKVDGDGFSKSFYCGCSFSNDKKVDFKSCGYRVRRDLKRASRIEFEHVVPASAFGRQFTAWIKGHPGCTRKSGSKSTRPYKGRRCLEKVSPAFRLMESDMYNLWPAVGEVNGDRSNYDMGEIAGEARVYGKCDVEIKDRVAEPPKRVRGDIARAYMYMDWAYPKFNLLNEEKLTMFKRWSKEDPVDRWERERARRIEKIQGNKNPFIQ